MVFPDIRNDSFSETKRSEHPCSTCAKRKVKCDRLIPCTNCVKRGQEKQCIQSNSKSDTSADWYPSLSNVLAFWQKYEYWVMDVGLMKSNRIDAANHYVDVVEDFQESCFWATLLGRDQSFKLLDYSMEKLGGLYFGCFGDISELYLLLEEYWQRRDAEDENKEDENKEDENNEGHFLLSSDDYYCDAILWSIFTMTIYYMPLKKIKLVLPSLVDQHDDSKEMKKEEWSEDTRTKLIQAFTKCTISQLYKAQFMSIPDIRVIQVYLILASTSFPWTNVYLANSIRLQCFNIAKTFHVNQFKRSINDSTFMRLTKLTCEKLWYRLSVCDYLYANPNDNICFHTELSSLLQHAAYLENLPSVDVYQSEQSFEVFYWKIISLQRDLDQYLTRDMKPPLKTLDAIQRQINIFNEKLLLEQDGDTLKSDFEKFLITYLLRMTSWKLYKMYFVYHRISSSFEKMIHYAKNMISLTVKNIKQPGNIIFNSHALVLRCIISISSFYAFYGIFDRSSEVENLNLDISELICSLPSVFDSKLINLRYLLERFSRLTQIWNTVHLVDPRDSLKHPVIGILKNDVRNITKRFQQMPPLIKGTDLTSGRRNFENEQTDTIEENDFELIISPFESQNPIDSIIM